MTEQLPFFVYGTLLPGQPNDHLWQEKVITREEALLVNGRLYDMGFYPMLVEEVGHRVKGVALTVRPDAYEMVVQALDNLEGFDPAQPDAPGYRRVAREVVLGNGRAIQAWVYIGQPSYVEGCFPISGGDWRRHAADQLNDMTDWWGDIDTVLGRHG